MRVCGWAQTHVSAWCGHGMGEGRGVRQATRWVMGKGGGAPGTVLGWRQLETPTFPLPLAGHRNRDRHSAVCACVE